MITKLIDKISELIKLKLDQFKLEAQGHIASVAARIVVFLAFLVLVSFALLFLGLTLAFALNEWWDSAYLGFLAVAGLLIIFIVLLGVVAKSQSLAKAIERSIIETSQEPAEDEALPGV
ncbi:MAG: phage holin family protein [Bacteroidota bacterium]